MKVLDFGLAKMAEPAAHGDDPEISPTLTVQPATRVGVILCTAAYMAPEQARGKVLDKSGPISGAFGVVLYEMLNQRTSAMRPPIATCGGITLPSAKPVQ